jgi:hypothetical protein
MLSGSFIPDRNYDLEMTTDTENRSLKRRLKTLETHMKRTEALATFLRKNPTLAADCAIKATMYGGQVSLYFEERAYIHAVGSDPVQLRLQRDYGSARPGQETNVFEDLAVLSRQKLKAVLRKVKVDLD